MTNKERVTALSTKDFIDEMGVLLKHRLAVYIDYEKYFDSEDTDIFSSIRSIGKARCRPSFAAIKSFENEHMGDDNIELLKKQFIDTHTFPCLLLEKTAVFGKPYWIICKENEDMLIKTPAENIVDIVSDNKEAFM